MANCNFKTYYESHGIRFFPSYTQTGDSFGLEKSKVDMIKEEVKKAMEVGSF